MDYYIHKQIKIKLAGMISVQHRIHTRQLVAKYLVQLFSLL